MGKRLLSIILISFLTINLCACYSNSGVLGADENIKNLRVLDINLTDEPYGIGVDKNKPELLAQINEFIAKINSDGTMDEILSHYQNGYVAESVKEYAIDETRDQLVVVSTGDFAPFDYDEGDKHYGIDKEIVAALAEYLGKELVIVNVNFDMLFMTIYNHKADICIAGITITDERAQYVDFSDPYYHGALNVAVASSDDRFNNCKTREEVDDILRGLDKHTRIAVENNTTSEDYLDERISTVFQEGIIEKIGCKDIDECITLLKADNVDMVIGDGAVIKYIYGKDIE